MGLHVLFEVKVTNGSCCVVCPYVLNYIFFGIKLISTCWVLYEHIVNVLFVGHPKSQTSYLLHCVLDELFRKCDSGKYSFPTFLYTKVSRSAADEQKNNQPQLRSGHS
jgi:hypothetical protein